MQLLDKICYIETECSFKIYIMILLLNLTKQKGLKIRYYVSYWLYLRYYNDLFDFFLFDYSCIFTHLLELVGVDRYYTKTSIHSIF